MANTKVTSRVLADDAVGLAQLNISNDPSNGQALTYVASSNDLQWATISGGVDGISSSADATAITINSSEQVGIGTTSPDVTLHVANAGDAHFKVQNTSASKNFQIITGGSGARVRSDDALIFDTGSSPSERMRIDSTSGNVAIGTSSTDIESLGSNYRQLTIASNTSLYPAMVTYQTPSTTNSSAEIARIHYLNGTNRVGQFLVKPEGANNSAFMAWSTMNSGTLKERLRVTKGGGILINEGEANARNDEALVVGNNSTGNTNAHIKVRDDIGKGAIDNSYSIFTVSKNITANTATNILRFQNREGAGGGRFYYGYSTSGKARVRIDRVGFTYGESTLTNELNKGRGGETLSLSISSSADVHTVSVTANNTVGVTLTFLINSVGVTSTVYNENIEKL